MGVWGLELCDFVYLSDGKISQFLPEPGRLRFPGALRLNTPVGAWTHLRPTASGNGCAD